MLLVRVLDCVYRYVDWEMLREERALELSASPAQRRILIRREDEDGDIDIKCFLTLVSRLDFHQMPPGSHLLLLFVFDGNAMLPMVSVQERCQTLVMISVFRPEIDLDLCLPASQSVQGF